MKKDRNLIIIILAIVACILGLKFAQTDFEESYHADHENRIDATQRAKNSDILYPISFRDKGPQSENDTYRLEEIPREKRILKGDKMLQFKTKAELEAFLKKAQQKGFKITKILPNLKMVRVRFTSRIDADDFLARFGEVSLIADNTPIGVPEPLLSGGSTGFRSNPLEFLGIENNGNWGDGVKVAVIDTGVASHPSLKGEITHFDLVNDGTEITGHHGTAVASLIAGDAGLIKGVSPGVDLIDIRALNNDGSGDAFTVAEAIALAADSGAKVINLSLGANYDNPALREAVLYAQGKGAILVAAVGNEGAGKVSYPAGYPGVIGVASNDANENYLSFSNRGPEVDIAAPGIELTAAGLEGETILFTGTSASSPLVAATVAYQMAQYPNLTNEELVNQLQSNANEVGAPGDDNLFGNGILNVGRIEDNSNMATVDAAAARFYLEPVAGTDNLKLFFTGENRGTQTVEKVEMTLSYPGFERTYTFNNIESSQAFYETLIINPNSELVQKEQEITLTVKQSGGEKDLSNNVKAVRIRLNTEDE